MKSHTMTRSPITSLRALAWVAAVILLFAAASQATNVAEPPHGLGFAYDQSREITLTGTLQQVVSHPPKGSLMGTHLLVSANGQVIDAHVGPFLSKANQQALRVGQPIQIVGVNDSVHGKNVLLARQLVFGGRQIAVRSEHGLLLEGGAVHHKSNSKRAENGGTR